VKGEKYDLPTRMDGMLRHAVGFLTLTLLLGAPITASAGPMFLEKRNVSATRPVTISISSLASTPAAKRRIVLTLPSSKADRQTLEFEVDGPKGTGVSFYSSMLTPKTLTDLNPKRKVVQAGLIYDYTGTGKKEVTLGESDSGNTGGGNSTSGDYECGCLTADDVTGLIVSFRTAGITYTRAQVCEQFTSLPFGDCAPDNSFPGGSIGFGNTAALSAFVQRDACAAGGKLPGKAVIVFDLSKVPANLFPNGKITVKPTFSGYGGNKQVKLKKAGDAEGKFAGKALLLASPANGVSFTGSIGEVTLVKYAKNKQTFNKKIPVADYVFYRTMLLWRVPLGGVLQGGQGTFQIKGNAAGYSICAKLVRQDQFFNGYPRNSE